MRVEAAITSGWTGRHRPRGRLKRFGLALPCVLVLGGVLLAALALQLRNGSLDLGFLRARLESAVAARLPPGSSVSLGRASLAYDPQEGLLASFGDVALSLPGAAELRVENAVASLPLAGLLDGAPTMRALRVSGVEAAVDVPADMPLSGPRADRLRAWSTAFGAAYAEAERRLAGHGVESITIEDVSVAALPGSGIELPPALRRIARVNWMAVAGGRAKLWAEGAGEADARGWSLNVADEGGADGVRSLRLDLIDLPTTALAPSLGDRALPPCFVAPLALRATLRLGPGGEFDRLQAVLSAGPGYLSLGERDSTLIATAELGLDLPPKGDRLRVAAEAVAADARRFVIDGLAALGDFGEPIDLLAHAGATVLPAAGVAGISDFAGPVRARLSPASRSITIDRLELAGADGFVSLAGTFAAEGPGAGIALAIRSSEMPVATAKALWPPWVAEDTRDWVNEFVHDGRVGPLDITVALPIGHIGPASRGKPLPPFALHGAVPFRDVTFVPVPDLPTATRVAGTVSLADGAALVDLAGGGFMMPDGADIAAGGSVMVVRELGRHDPVGELSLQLAGPAAALARLADAGPFNIATENGIGADTLTGAAELTVVASVPLVGTTPPDELSPEFRLALSDVTSEVPIDGRRIAGADLVISGNLAAYRIEGGAEIDGVFTQIAMVAGGAGQAAEYTLTLDEAAREKLGFDIGGILEGPVEASLRELGDGRQEVSLDLTGARLSLPMIGWEKGAGVAATADLVLRKDGAETVIESAALSGRGFSARGSARIDAKGLASLKLTDVSLRQGDAFNLAVKRVRRGYEASLSGASLDARSLIRAMKAEGGGASADAPSISLSLALKSVRAENGVVLRDVRGSLAIDGSGVRSGEVHGATAKGRAFDVTVTARGGARNIVARAADAGQALRALDVYGKLSGGQLVLSYAAAAEAGRGDGVLVIDRFRVIDEKTLVKAVDGRAPKAVAKDGEVDTATNMRFRRLRVPFALSGDTLSIGESTMQGVLLGATARGSVDLKRREVALSGTLIPVFGINNIAGSIPLFGEILAGGRNEGLVGITFKMSGPLDKPKLRMNPISAIAPGIFRRIFEYR